MNITKSTSPPLLKISGLIFMLFAAFQISAAEPKPISEIKMLGIDLLKADPKSIRKHMSNLGGFLQSKTAAGQTNLDKYFPWSNNRDSYYFLFRFNHAGKVTSVKRLYRPYSLEQSNKRLTIQTKDVARELIKKLGQPTSVARKGWGGTRNYATYTWQDDKMTITVDREGSEKLGNVFIKYTINIHDPYEVKYKGDA
ncbi:MAG: hypothetical protein ISEC1_P1251 [Thiomicrorhabdus sp.]|nr:MAG: hypothetical protein ISEC1_P1251 [Thiomicrorhabdus sp.]